MYCKLYREKKLKYKKNDFDKLFLVLANPKIRNILKGMCEPSNRNTDRIVTYSQMLTEFSFQEEEDKAKKSGLFSYSLRKLVQLKLVTKDKETGFYFITHSGKIALKGAKILEQALDEKTLNDENKQGRLVLRIERN